MIRLYDIDNNGVIDVDEMTEIIEILDSFSMEDPETPVQTPKEKAESLIQFMDVDNSGGITFDEFIKVSFIRSYFFILYLNILIRSESCFSQSKKMKIDENMS